MRKMLYFSFLFLVCSFFQVNAQHTVSIRLGANCSNLGTTVFSTYSSINEGTTYTVGDWTLPANYALVQPLYNALKGSTFEIESGALTEDIRIDWVLWNISCANGLYLPNGTLTQTVFNGYFIVYHQVSGNWVPKEPYPFSNGKKAILKLKNTLAFQNLLSVIPGGIVNLGFAYFVNNTFDPTGLTLSLPLPTNDTSKFFTVTAAHFSNLVGGNQNQLTDVNEQFNPVPAAFTLMQNYPNPFNPSTSIQYSIPERTFVELNVYNVLGVKVTSLVRGTKEAGTYNIQFDGANLSSGLYIYELKTNKFTSSRKMILLK